MPRRFSPLDSPADGTAAGAAAGTGALGWGAATGAGLRRGPDADGDLSRPRADFAGEVAAEIGVDLRRAGARLPDVRRFEAVTHSRPSRRDR